MGMKFKRPILVGGLGLTAGLWALESLQHTAADFGGSIVLGSVVIGSGLWWLQRRSPVASLPLSVRPGPVNQQVLEQAFQRAHHLIEVLTAELQSHPDRLTPQRETQVQALRDRLQALQTSDRPQAVQIAVVGAQKTGKTALVQHLQALHASDITWLDTSPLLVNAEAQSQAGFDLPTVDAASLTIFVTSGDLTDSEFQIIQQLIALRHRLVLAFNKQDQYRPEDRLAILQRLQHRLADCLPDTDVVAIATVPNPIKVRQHQADGQMQEWIEHPEADVTPLSDRLQAILQEEKAQLALATTWRQAKALQRDIQTTLNQIRRDRAMPVLPNPLQ